MEKQTELSHLAKMRVSSLDCSSDTLRPRSRLLTLPLEILLQVLTCFTAEYKEERATLVNLVKTCRMLHKILEPQLYHSIILQARYFDEKDALADLLLVRTLQRRPDILKYCRSLCTGINFYITPSDAVNILASAAPYIRDLSLSSQRNSRLFSEKVTRLLPSMKLSSLKLDGFICIDVINRCLAHNDLPDLSQLQLSYSENVVVSGEEMDCLQPATSTVRNLYLNTDTWELFTIRRIVLWCMCLEKLEVNVAAHGLVMQQRHELHSTSATQMIVDLVSDSLAELKLAQWWKFDSRKMIDLTFVLRLRLLSLHWSNVFNLSPPEFESHLPQSLERLEVDMQWLDQQGHGYVELTEEMVDWLVKLVKTRKERLSRFKLQHVRIVYHLDEDHTYQLVHCVSEEEALKCWPWTNQNRMKDVLQHFTVEASWPKPDMDKTSWIQEWKRRRDWIEEEDQMTDEAEDACGDW